MQRWQVVTKYAKFVPAVILLSLIDAPIPIRHQAQREVNSYFQTLALARDGLVSYAYSTPYESGSGFHMHSILSTPFVALGWTDGGRFVSWLAALVAIVLLYLIAREYFDREVAAIASCVLWLQPVFLRSAYSYMPETLSVALTLATLYGTLRYVRIKKQVWLGVAAVALLLAIGTHSWEATIVLPAAVLLYINNHRMESVGLGVLSVLGVVGTTVVLQLVASENAAMTLSPSRYRVYVFFAMENYELFFSPDWWFLLKSVHPYHLSVALTLPSAFLLTLYTAKRAYNSMEESWVLLTSWLLSGLSILFLFPRGFAVHGDYFLWALLAPVALTAAVLCKQTLDYVLTSTDVSIDRPTAVASTVVTLTLIVCLYATIFEVGGVVPGLSGPAQPTADTQAAIDAGQELQEAGVTEISDICFAGHWSGGNADEPVLDNMTAPMARTLIYSGALTYNNPGHKGPLRSEVMVDSPEACPTTVVRDEQGTIEVRA